MIYFFQYLTWIFGRIVWPQVFELRISGADNVSTINKEGAVFIANHQSYADAFIIGSCLPWQYYRKNGTFRYLTDSKYIFKKIYGLFLLLDGCYPVFKSGGNMEKSLKKTIEYLQNGKSILIFPTGKRQATFDPSQARPGIAYLAKTANPLFVPVKIFIDNIDTIPSFDPAQGWGEEGSTKSSPPFQGGVGVVTAEKRQAQRGHRSTAKSCATVTFGQPFYAPDIIENFETKDLKTVARELADKIAIL